MAEYTERLSNLDALQFEQFIQLFITSVDTGNGFNFRSHTVEVAPNKAIICELIRVVGLSLGNDPKAIEKLRDILKKNSQKIHFLFPDTAEGKSLRVVIATQKNDKPGVWVPRSRESSHRTYVDKYPGQYSQRRDRFI